MNLQKIYEYALQREKEGYKFFKGNADKATHAAAAEVFQKLADEELMHIKFIENLLENPNGKVEATFFSTTVPSQHS